MRCSECWMPVVEVVCFGSTNKMKIHYAIIMFSQTKDENGKLISAEEILEQLHSNKPELLLIEGSLI
ncbi:hypothetical protein MKY08_11270 [Lysinibacillus sp. FSL M8-0337]|uniref:hypothetical protein n=1 Tax=Lysinibacillus TaxID=400634 RepID=UPI00159F215B|nr:hypothetical protein [Lysinibacillus sphaericus]